MAKLQGRAVGDVIAEFYGPITGRNYNVNGAATPVTPTVRAIVTGTGAVEVQENTTPVYRGNPGPNTFTHSMEGDPAGWSTASGGGPGTNLTATLTPDNVYCAVRVVVTTAGTGKVMIDSLWV